MLVLQTRGFSLHRSGAVRNSVYHGFFAHFIAVTARLQRETS